MADRRETDKRWMAQALDQARLGWGRTSPNPMVGAVVVRDGRCVGQGCHHAAGLPHAEIEALNDAGDQARGATLYVTLEPCSTHGRTPPCTDAVVEAGLERVVIGCLDANPEHAGSALTLLKHHRIKVSSGVLEGECKRLNESFFWWIRQRRPFVTLKMGMTLDGRIATPAGLSQWITGPAAREQVQRLRQWADAIMVGGETVRKDNPSLTVRSPADWPRQPLPCVWTSKPLPGDCGLSRRRDPETLVAKPRTTDQWLGFLHTLGNREVTALLLEGGGELAASALQAGAVNKVAFFVAPKILGGRNSRPAVGGTDPDTLDDAVQINEFTCERVGDDVLLMGYCQNVHRTD